MRIDKLERMQRGWFVGSFEPNAFNTDAVEVGVQSYLKGTKEVWHYHRIATEVTVIVSGRVRMNDKYLQAGDIVTIEPGTGTDFEVLEDTLTVVVKVPGVLDDKYTADSDL